MKNWRLVSSTWQMMLAVLVVIGLGFSLARGGGKAGSGDLVLCTNWGDDTVSLVNVKEGKELAVI